MQPLQRHRQKPATIQPIARRGHRSGPDPAQCAPRPVADAFLRSRFEPIRLTDQVELQDQIGVESSFFTSLVHLATLYNLPLEALTSPAVYPLNIALSYQLVERSLQQVAPNLELIIIQDEHRLATLATVERFELDYCAYYIPVQPYWELRKKRTRKARTDLIATLLNYLDQAIQVPYFVDAGSYVEYEYDQIRENYEEYEDEEEREELYTYLEQIDHQGRRCRSHFRKAASIASLAERVARFKPKSNSDQCLLGVAKQVLTLSQHYPGRSIWGSIEPKVELKEDFGEPPIQLDQYLSFVWANNDMPFDWIVETLNNCCEAGSQVDAPKSLQLFDQPQAKAKHSFHFETLLFGLLDEFIPYLNNLSNE